MIPFFFFHKNRQKAETSVSAFCCAQTLRLPAFRPLVTWPDCDEDAWYYADMMEATNSHDYQWITVEGQKTEKWTEKLPQRDWAALEHTWSTANSAKGGEVVG